MKRRRINWVWEDPDAARAFEEWVGFPDAEDTAKEVDQIIASTGINPPARVLDVGCGTGRHSLELAHRGFRVVGIDVSDRFIGMANAKPRSRAMDVDFKLMRASELEYSSEFEFALAWNHTLGFMSDQELGSGFSRIERALKSGGKFLLVLAGPKLTHEWPPQDERTWAESHGRFILTDKQFDGDIRVERSIVIDPGADQITEFEERQRAMSFDSVQTLLRTAGFADVECLSMLDGEPADADNFGVFICRSE